MAEQKPGMLVASSLEDIAALFDSRADELAGERFRKALSRERTESAVREKVWREAAALLRNTKLEEPVYIGPAKLGKI